MTSDTTASAHTAGPWILEETPMQFVIKAPHNDEDYYQKTVAVTAGLQSNNRANAKLISAAPELLEALKNALGDATMQLSLSERAERAMEWKKVISKAESL